MEDEWIKQAEEKIKRMPAEAKALRENALNDLFFFAQLVNPGYVYGEIHKKIFKWMESKKKGVITKPQVIAKLSQLQDTLATYPQLSKSLSIADASKFARQAFYNGDPDRYDLIQRSEQSYIAPFFRFEYGAKGSEKAFIDSTKSQTLS